MAKWKAQNALPIRCTYLDTDVLAERLIALYGSEDNFQLVVCPFPIIFPLPRQLEFLSNVSIFM